MDEKISLEAIALYSDGYAEKLVKGFFQKKETINGSEILAFSNVQQVNLFIVKELFKNWKEETKKIRSPYFDYDNPEVKEALENLMNLLSKNISIGQVHFTPLVKKATSQALLLIFDPYDFFSILIAGKNNKLEVASFREEIKYLRVNKAPLERMLQKLEERNVSEVSGNEAFSILDQILEEVNFNPEDIDPYIEKFSVVSPLNPNTFFIAKNDEVSELPLPPSMKIHDVPVIPEKEIPRVIAPFPATDEKKFNIPKAESEPVPLSPPVQRTPIQATQKEGRTTLAENFQKIKKIKESLTINQKFMFTKVLFHGDFELFSRAIERLDQFDSLDSALRYIEEEHASTWDRESEEFHEFMELVEMRFA